MARSNFIKKLAYFDGNLYLKKVLAQRAFTIGQKGDPKAIIARGLSLITSAMQQSQPIIDEAEKPSNWTLGLMGREDTATAFNQAGYFKKIEKEIAAVQALLDKGDPLSQQLLLDPLNNLSDALQAVTTFAKGAMQSQYKDTGKELTAFSEKCSEIFENYIKRAYEMLPERSITSITPTSVAAAPVADGSSGAIPGSAPATPPLPGNLTEPEKRYIEELRAAKTESDAKEAFRRRVEYIKPQKISEEAKALYMRRASEIYASVRNPQGAGSSASSSPMSSDQKRDVVPGNVPNPDSAWYNDAGWKRLDVGTQNEMTKLDAAWSAEFDAKESVSTAADKETDAGKDTIDATEPHTARDAAINRAKRLGILLKEKRT